MAFANRNRGGRTFFFFFYREKNGLKYVTSLSRIVKPTFRKKRAICFEIPAPFSPLFFLHPFHFLSFFFFLLLNKLETRRLHVIAWNISFECPVLVQVPPVFILPPRGTKFRLLCRDNRFASARGPILKFLLRGKRGVFLPSRVSIFVLED